MSKIDRTITAGRWDLDLATGMLKLCAQSRKMFGFSNHSSEILKEGQWVNRLRPDDLGAVRRAMEACVQRQIPYAERFRTIHRNGSVRYLLGVGRPLEDGAKHGRFGGWNFDVDSTVKLAGEWISRHSDFAAIEHGCSVEPAPSSGNLASKQIEADALLERAKSILRIRRSRERLLGRAMIGEPAFDFLMYLYVRSEERDTSLTTLGNTAAVPYSSAIRWITYLSDKGLVTRTLSDGDRRVICVGLTTRGRAIVDEFLSAR